MPRMLVEREEILSLLGPKAAGGPGSAVSFVLAGTTRRARFEVGRDGTIYADVTEDIGEDASEVVTLRVEQSPDGASSATGRDLSGEASDPNDPMTAVNA
jgi:hypothetical protein